MYERAYNIAIDGGKSVEEAVKAAGEAIALAGYNATPEFDIKEETITMQVPAGW
jgi:hypothetical protein